MVVSITYAKIHLCRLVRLIESHKEKEIVITRRGVPIVALVPIKRAVVTKPKMRKNRR